MQRVLITGATGLLGCTLAATLASRGWHVVRHGRRGGDLSGDLTDARDAKQTIEQAGAECIVNLAALTDVDRCEAHPREAYLQNTRIVENLVAAIRRTQRTPYLVQISTDQVYDGPGPHREEDVMLTNYYSFSKYAGEMAATGTPSTILRTNFFGASRVAGRASFSDWIVTALERGDAVRVFTDVWFNPLSIERLAAMIALVLERRVGGVFNLGSREGMTKADFCYVLAQTLGLATATMTRSESGAAALRAYRPKDMRMACDRFEAAFAVKLPTLRQEIESMRDCYHGRA
jgi:dTDP-4-dehydrorhamnose reductase